MKADDYKSEGASVPKDYPTPQISDEDVEQLRQHLMQQVQSLGQNAPIEAYSLAVIARMRRAEAERDAAIKTRDCAVYDQMCLQAKCDSLKAERDALKAEGLIDTLTDNHNLMVELKKQVKGLTSVVWTSPGIGYAHVQQLNKVFNRTVSESNQGI